MPTIYQDIFLDPNDSGLKSYVESGYDEKLLRELIWDMQELYILPIIGTGLYDQLRTQSRAGNLSALNQTLLFEKIRPVLKWIVLTNGQHIFTYKIRKQGVVKQNSENSTSADIADIDRMFKQFTAWAQTYAERLKNYLIENESDYPLYYDPGDGIDVIHPSGTQYHVGWVMTKTGRYGEPPYNPCCDGENNTIDL